MSEVAVAIPAELSIRRRDVHQLLHIRSQNVAPLKNVVIFPDMLTTFPFALQANPQNERRR